VAHLNPRPEVPMAPMNSNKDTKRMVGGTSGSALSVMTRRSVPPPTPAPDIPHPLGEPCHQAAIGRGKEKGGQTMTAREISGWSLFAEVRHVSSGTNRRKL
jgi:hypothetical protein